jgi:hypothetical protein
MNVAPLFRQLKRDRPWFDRPWFGLMLGGSFFATAGLLRWFLGEVSEGFGPMTFLPAIMLAGVFGGI